MKLRITRSIAVLALAVSSLVSVGASPAAAACPTDWHRTQYRSAQYRVSLAQTIPSSSTCNDVNLTGASSPGWVSGQYYSGSWITGSAGWKYAPFGSQSPWQVLISNLSNGTWYRLRGQIYNQVFTTAV